MYNDERYILLRTVKNIDCRFLFVNETALIKTPLFGNRSVDVHTNTQILYAPIEYIVTTKRFDGYLFHYFFCFFVVYKFVIERKKKAMKGMYISKNQ